MQCSAPRPLPSHKHENSEMLELSTASESLKEVLRFEIARMQDVQVANAVTAIIYIAYSVRSISPVDLVLRMILSV
jgi:hypothetical protein